MRQLDSTSLSAFSFCFSASLCCRAVSRSAAFSCFSLSFSCFSLSFSCLSLSLAAAFSCFSLINHIARCYQRHGSRILEVQGLVQSQSEINHVYDDMG